MKRPRVLLIVALTLLTAACNPAVTSPSATITLASTSTQPPVTALAETPQAANTLQPMTTPTLTPAAATETPASTPDFYVTATAIVKAVITARQPRIYASYLSPDKKWQTEIVIYDCIPVGEENVNAYEQLKLIQISDGTEKVVDSQLQFCGGLGARGLAGRFWSSNSRYFYYTDAREGVPDGFCGYWEPSLIRLDVTSQSLEHLGEGPLSRDKTRIATWQGNDLVVWNLDHGEAARAPAIAPEATRGAIVWSPDSQALLYLETASYCFPFGKSYVVKLDLPTLTSTLLIESETPSFIGASWDAPDQIQLSDEDGKAWGYNLVTKELQPVP
jgi:hypothetical protein